MNAAINLLDSHSGRGCILRTIQYGSLMVSGLKFVTKQNQRRLSALSSQLSLCRTILRLFDDIPMLSHSLSYGLGSQESAGGKTDLSFPRRNEKSLFLRSITLAQNLTDQLFFPIEHIAWASDAGILSIPSERFHNWSVYCWLISLAIGIIRNLINLSQLRLREAKKKAADVSGSRSPKLSTEEVWTSLSLVSDMADLVNCIHYLPAGVLWSGKLSTFLVGLFGSVSSIIPLWKTIQSLR